LREYCLWERGALARRNNDLCTIKDSDERVRIQMLVNERDINVRSKTRPVSELDGAALVVIENDDAWHLDLPSTGERWRDAVEPT
jgi:hypothetical protein